MRALALSFVVVVLSGCGDDPPADVDGAYTVDVSNDDDGCELSIPTGSTDLTLSQDADDGSILTVEVDGTPLAPFLGITIGGTTFNGTLSGTAFSVTRSGSVRQEGGCTYHVNAQIDGVVSGDTMSGTITYEGVTNDAADCVLVDDCTSTQSF